MQRRGTKQSPGANHQERKFIGVIKQLPCAACGQPGPSIADHIFGSSKKLYNGIERVHVGHWAVIPLCFGCDSIKTMGSRRAFVEVAGDPIELWFGMLREHDLIKCVPENVRLAMAGEVIPW